MAGVAFPGINLENVASLRIDNLTSRPPGPHDDVTRGYAADDLWQENGRIWSCYRANAGKAVWYPYRSRLTGVNGAAALPADVTSGCIFAIGTMKLRAAWTGAIVNVERESDAAAADLASVGANLDRQAALALAGTSELRTATAYDQSGNGNHVTASGASRPYLTKTPLFGDKLAFAFANNYSGSQADANIQYFNIPNTLTVDAKSHTVIAYWCPAHSTREARLLWWTRQDTSADYYIGHSNSRMTTRGVASRNGTNHGIPIEPLAYVWDSGALSTNMRVYTPRRRLDSFSALPTATLVAKTIGGGAGGSSKMRGHLGALLIYNRQLTEEETISVIASLNAHFGGRPQLRGTIVCDGDSIVEGPSHHTFMSWPAQVRYITKASALFYNAGISGSSWFSQEEGSADWRTGAAQDAPYRYLIAAMGTNIVGAGGTAADELAAKIAYFNTVSGAVDWTKIITTTMLPRGLFNDNPSTYGTVATEINTNTRNLYRDWADELIDWADDPTFSVATVVDDTNIYSDRTHPVPNGNQIMATVINSKIEKAEAVW